MVDCLKKEHGVLLVGRGAIKLRKLLARAEALDRADRMWDALSLTLKTPPPELFVQLMT